VNIMKSRDRFRAGWILALALVFIALAGGACYNSPTSPYGGGGGGGGGGGTAFNLGPFRLGQSVTFTFANAGTFGYHCIPHRNMGMTGTVQVDASGADSLVVQIGPGNGFSFSPESAHIKPGGYVRWVNASNLTIHTVTSD
jgi:plastocyanin